MDYYDLWVKGMHGELLRHKDDAKDFLRWAANYGLFPEEEWAKKFMLVGRLKKIMWERVGKRPFRWCPVVELRMPWGCSACCKHCPGAEKALKHKIPITASTNDSILDALKELKLPETITISADWGEPGLYPDTLDAINKEVEKRWLVTKYLVLTNLSVLENIKKVLPYARVVTVQFTMSEPDHALKIMCYKDKDKFEEIFNNIKELCELKKQGKISAKIYVLFLVGPHTVRHISDHYNLFKNMEGLTSCRYTAMHNLRPFFGRHPEAEKQKRLLQLSKGRVEYEWQV